jgi:hypothetical protein
VLQAVCTEEYLLGRKDSYLFDDCGNVTVRLTVDLAFFFVFSLTPSVKADSLSRFPVAADVEAACVMAGGSAVVSTMGSVKTSTSGR